MGSSTPRIGPMTAFGIDRARDFVQALSVAKARVPSEMEDAITQAPGANPGASPPQMPKLMTPRSVGSSMATRGAGNDPRTTVRTAGLAMIFASNWSPTTATMARSRPRYDVQDARSATAEAVAAVIEPLEAPSRRPTPKTFFDTERHGDSTSIRPGSASTDTRASRIAAPGDRVLISPKAMAGSCERLGIRWIDESLQLLDTLVAQRGARKNVARRRMQVNLPESGRQAVKEKA